MAFKLDVSMPSWEIFEHQERPQESVFGCGFGASLGGNGIHFGWNGMLGEGTKELGCTLRRLGPLKDC